MKQIANIFRLFFLVMAIVAKAHGATFIQALVTVTNTPTVNGNSITVNGLTRTFTNSAISNPSQMVLTNAAIGGSATNLFAEIAAYPFSGTMQASRSGTNGIILRGGPDETMAVSISAGWATLVLSTNNSTSTYEVRAPINATPAGTNIASLLLRDLMEKSTNAAAATSPALTNFVNTAGAQNVDGAKTFRGATIISNAAAMFVGGIISNATLTNVTVRATAGFFDALSMYGPLYMTNAFPAMSWWQVGGAADAKQTVLTTYGGQFQLLFFDDAGVGSNPALTIGRSGNVVTSTILYGTVLGTLFQGGIFTNAVMTNATAGFSSGTLSGVTITNSTLWGTIGKLGGGYLDGVGATNLVSTNGTFKGTNTFTGPVAFARVNHTALANGPNAGVDFGATSFVKIKPGPTAAFSIQGAAGGFADREVTIWNSTGQNMTIANENGGEPVPANRFTTLTGADITTTGDGAFRVKYDGETSRWIVIGSQL